MLKTAPVPKRVDHTTRRIEIAEATWRVLMRDGLSRTTVRAIVAESGLSSGAIRHYFSSQEELLRFVDTLVIERVKGRLEAVMADRGLDRRDKATRLCEELLPLDETRAMELTVTTAMAERTRVDESLHAQRRAQWDGIRVTAETVVELLAPTSSSPRSRAGRAHRERLAARLHVVLDGLAAQFVFYPGLLSGTAIEAALRAALEDIRRELRSPTRGASRQRS